MGAPAFACRRCGECCRGQGGIKVTEAEAALLARFLGLALSEFLARYTVLRHDQREIGARPDGACHFLHGQDCAVHQVKPSVCRRWPWLPGAMRHEAGFLGIKGGCPGVRPDATWNEFLAQGRAALRRDED